MGNSVTAISTSPSKEAAAREIGADMFVVSTDPESMKVYLLHTRYITQQRLSLHWTLHTEHMNTLQYSAQNHCTVYSVLYTILYKVQCLDITPQAAAGSCDLILNTVSVNHELSHYIPLLVGICTAPKCITWRLPHLVHISCCAAGHAGHPRHDRGGHERACCQWDPPHVQVPARPLQWQQGLISERLYWSKSLTNIIWCLFSFNSLLMPRRLSITGSVIGGLRETQQCIDFCHKHKIVPR